MHDQPRQILRQLIALYGADLHADPRRTEGLLRDYCADYPRECFVLIHAQRQRVPDDLLAAPAWLPQAALHSQLSQRLQTNLAFTAEAADWAVQAWSEALGITPPPPDRIWHWVRQQGAVAAKAGSHSRQFVRKMGGIQRGHFTGFGVQWQNAFGGRQLRVAQSHLKVLAAWGVGWLKERWLDWWQRLRSPILIAATLFFATLLLMTSSGPLASTMPRIATQSVADQSLPQTAWVVAGPLVVRSGPDLSAQPLQLLVAEQAVTVIAYSGDGNWAQISHPITGWVAHQFLRFTHEGVPTHAATLALISGRIIADRVNVRSGPGSDYAVIGYLVADQEVVFRETSLAHEWKEIIHPLHGWVSATLIAVDKD